MSNSLVAALDQRWNVLTANTRNRRVGSDGNENDCTPTARRSAGESPLSFLLRSPHAYTSASPAITPLFASGTVPDGELGSRLTRPVFTSTRETARGTR